MKDITNEQYFDEFVATRVTTGWNMAIELSYEEQSEVTTFEAVFQIDYWERLEMNTINDLNIPI